MKRKLNNRLVSGLRGKDFKDAQDRIECRSDMTDVYAIGIGVLGMDKLLASLCVMDPQFSQRQDACWDTLPTDPDSTFTPDAVARDKVWCAERQAVAAAAAPPEEITDAVREADAVELARQFALAAHGYTSVCMACATCHAICVLNVNRLDSKRFGFLD